MCKDIDPVPSELQVLIVVHSLLQYKPENNRFQVNKQHLNTL